MPRRTAREARDHARMRAVNRGLRYLERIASHPRHFPRFGSGLLYCCAFMASTTTAPSIRSRSRELAFNAYQLWLSLWKGTRQVTCADELTELIHGHLAARRIGVAVERRLNWLRRQAARFQARDFLGWDPQREPPPDTLREHCHCGTRNPLGACRCPNPDCATRLPRISRRRAFCMALTATFCGQRLGIQLGCSYRDVLRWLPSLPDYPPPSRPGAFHDAVYSATHVVYTLNDYGRFQLDPRWLPREYNFLARNLEPALALDDPDMVGEFLDSLRAFGVDDQHPAMITAMEYLIEAQNPDGSWGPRDNGHDYRRFHTTWAVLDGIRDFAWQGQGLAFPELKPQLEAWGTTHWMRRRRKSPGSP